MENVNVMTAVSDTAVESTKPKHKWLAKGSRFAKKAILTATVMSSMAAMCTTQAFAATGEVDTSSFISTACTVLKSVICLIGAGVGVWGVVNLLEGYGNDNPGAKVQQGYRSFSPFNADCVTLGYAAFFPYLPVSVVTDEIATSKR